MRCTTKTELVTTLLKRVEDQHPAVLYQNKSPAQSWDEVMDVNDVSLCRNCITHSMKKDIILSSTIRDSQPIQAWDQ